jgi:hypothetical protein
LAEILGSSMFLMGKRLGILFNGRDYDSRENVS